MENKKKSDINWRGAKYVWAAFQALVVMKIAILYFGGEMSIEPTPKNIALFLGALAFSFGSLIFFAYKEGRNNKDQF